MGSSEKPTTDCTENSWQEEAARLLLRSGFGPADTIGQVNHPANPQAVGRTFGSVWRAMRSSVEGEPGGATDEAKNPSEAPQ